MQAQGGLYECIETVMNSGNDWLMNIVIHHNPDCSKSRNVLQIIRDAGYDPTVIPYLETGWTRAQLQGLFAAAGLSPAAALYTGKGLAESSIQGGHR